MRFGMDTLYKQVEQAIRQHEEYLNVGNSITESDIRHAIRWVMRDNPDIFWFVHQYHFDKDNDVVYVSYKHLTMQTKRGVCRLVNGVAIEEEEGRER